MLAPPRKRTTSFSCPSSNPRPAKAPRTEMSLRRSESCVTLPHTDGATLVPYNRSLRYYKEQRDRRKALLGRHVDPVAIRTRFEVSFDPSDSFNVHLPPPHTAPTPPPIIIPTPKRIVAAPQPSVPLRTSPSSHPRTSSPLAPARAPLPPRACFPRSKPEPDLYRKAITTRMRASPAGQKILHMGPRLAVSIMAATQELERIVKAQTEADVVMGEAPSPTSPVLSNSWVVVPSEDWEMVDCSA